MPSNLNSVLTKQQRIAELAQRLPELAFTSLAYHIDLQWLEEAYHRTRKDVMNVIPKRFEKYGLTVHPDKTKLIDFRSPNYSERSRDGQLNDGKKDKECPETFELLGFTHYWGKTRNGKWAVQRKTMKSRLARSLQKIEQWCRRNRHKPMREQWKGLCAKVQGHYGYYGITGNACALGDFYRQVCRIWGRWLIRRNHRRQTIWAMIQHILSRFPLPTPKVVKSVFRRK